MFFRQEVITFCKTCNERGDYTSRKGLLYGYPISETAFLCTISFEKCGHKRCAILSPTQITKMQEVIDVQKQKA
jgi:hypothetical protein